MTHDKTEWKILFQIFGAFIKMGPVTFGGGYAMIPLIERDLIHNRKWVTQQDLADVLAIAGSAPGAIAVNTATFIGHRIAGYKGAIAATAGILLPTFLIVLLLAISYVYLRNNQKVDAAFQGIRPAIVALIVFAGWRIGKTAVFDKTTFWTTIAAVVILLVSHLHPVLVILLGLVAGIVQINLKTKLGIPTKLENFSNIQETLYNDYFTCPDYFIGDGI